MSVPHTARPSLVRRMLDPRLGLTLVSAALVTWYAVRAAREELGPGPLSRVHAALTQLGGAAGCARCHGEAGLVGGDPRAAMSAACNACHTEIGAQLAAARGFHGGLESGDDCARCHGEHHGAALEPYDTRAFALAGHGSRDSYHHEGLDFRLEGAHDGLACAACHPLADASSEVLAAARAADPTVGRFIGRSQTCGACHEDAHDGAFGVGCADCHGQSRPFAEAAQFVHTAAFALAGAHAGHACVTCHAEGSAYALDAYSRDRSRAGHVESAGTAPPARTCADCHASPHGPAFVEAAGTTCAACHAAEPSGFARADEQRSRAAHAVTGFVLVAADAVAADAHAALACDTCHDPRLPFAERHPGRAADSCATCHADPHGGQFGDVAAAPGLCARCHGTASFTSHGFDAVAHAATGFPLDGAHASASCAACHAAPTAGDPARYRGTPRTCAACHSDVHRGAFDRAGVGPKPASATRGDSSAGGAVAPPGVGAGTAVAANVTSAESSQRAVGCARCHDTRSFRGAADGFDHAAWTGYALDGAHAALDCQECHLQEPGGGRRLGPIALAFRPGASAADVARCTACHGDPHGGRFDGVALPEVVDGRAGCARCHGTAKFAEVPPARFDHGRWTGFALRGAHEHTRCSACHGVGATPAEPSIRDARVARRLGAVADVFPGPVDQCATCHTNPHGERYDVHAPDLVEGRQGCARCHGEATFRQPLAFDHAWTGFALVGAHAAAACSACHPTTPPDVHGKTRGPAAGTACAACHADPHGGQFATAGGTDCARCHDPSGTFAAPRFDHATSRFPLDEVHARLACAACHRPARTKDGRELVRYRPLGTACADCHGATGRGGGPP